MIASKVFEERDSQGEYPFPFLHKNKKPNIMAKEHFLLRGITSTVELKMAFRRDIGFPETPMEVQKFYNSRTEGYNQWLEESLMIAIQTIKDLEDDQRNRL